MSYLSSLLSGLSFSLPHLELLIIPSLAMLFLSLQKVQPLRSRIQKTSIFFFFTFLGTFHSVPVAVHNYFQCSWPLALLISLSLQTAFMLLYLVFPWVCLYRWRRLEIPLWKLAIIFFIPLFPLNFVFPFHFGYQLLALSPWVNFWAQVFGFLNLSLWTFAFSATLAMLFTNEKKTGLLGSLILIIFLFGGSLFNRTVKPSQDFISYAILQPNFSKHEKELARKEDLVAAKQLDQLLGFSLRALQASKDS
jgi:apolipoprotein N-acyltransferase